GGVPGGVEHAHEHERPAHRLDEHVQGEQPRTGPVGFELPAEPRRQAQGAKACEHEGMIRAKTSRTMNAEKARSGEDETPFTTESQRSQGKTQRPREVLC